MAGTIQYRLIDEEGNPLQMTSLEDNKPVAAEVSHIKRKGDNLEIILVAIKPEGRSYSIKERGKIKAAYRKQVEG